jgi:hypothetical protein
MKQDTSQPRDRIQVSKEFILEHLSPKEIMEYYTGYSITDNKPKYRNPLRPDRTGKCYFKQYSKSYMLVDKADPDYSVDCFGLVMKMFNLDFPSCLVRIKADLLSNVKLTSNSYTPSHTTSVKSEAPQAEYDVVLRDWNEDDELLWSQFYIRTSTLSRLNLFPVASYKRKAADSNVFQLVYDYTSNSSSNPVACYAIVFKKRKTRVKLYRPGQDILKWEGNVGVTDLFGEHDLPDQLNDLYVASGVKDLACVLECGMYGVAPQSETNDVSKQIAALASKKQTNCVYVVYDNDDTGIKYQNRLLSKLRELGVNCKGIVVPNSVRNTRTKDLAEYCRHAGLDPTDRLLKGF